jgi:hypothetical protein
MQCTGYWEAAMIAAKARSQDITVNYIVMIRRWVCGQMKMFMDEDMFHHCCLVSAKQTSWQW